MIRLPCASARYYYARFDAADACHAVLLAYAISRQPRGRHMSPERRYATCWRSATLPPYHFSVTLRAIVVSPVTYGAILMRASITLMPLPL